MRLLISMVLAGAMAWGAEVCPPGKGTESGSEPAGVSWRSVRGEPRPRKFCIANELRNQAAEAVEVVWPDAGIERATVRGELRIAECCFDGVETGKSTLRQGDHSVEVTMYRAAEEGMAHHEEGYPDLIEEDARVRTVSIRGTFSAGGRDVRVDVELKCSASQFAKQFAYQYSIVNRSADPVEVAWDLVDRMRAVATPAIGSVPNGKTYLFISDKAPSEAEGSVVLRTKSGAGAATFRLDGFAANQNGR